MFRINGHKSPTSTNGSFAYKLRRPNITAGACYKGNASISSLMGVFGAMGQQGRNKSVIKQGHGAFCLFFHLFGRADGMHLDRTCIKGTGIKIKTGLGGHHGHCKIRLEGKGGFSRIGVNAAWQVDGKDRNSQLLKGAYKGKDGLPEAAMKARSYKAI